MKRFTGQMDSSAPRFEFPLSLLAACLALFFADPGTKKTSARRILRVILTNWQFKVHVGMSVGISIPPIRLEVG